MGMNGNGMGLVDPITGAQLLPTGIVATTCDATGTTVALIIEGKPWAVRVGLDGGLHLQPGRDKAPVLTIPFTSLPDLYHNNIERKVMPPGVQGETH